MTNEIQTSITKSEIDLLADTLKEHNLKEIIIEKGSVKLTLKGNTTEVTESDENKK